MGPQRCPRSDRPSPAAALGRAPVAAPACVLAAALAVTAACTAAEEDPAPQGRPTSPAVPTGTPTTTTPTPTPTPSPSEPPTVEAARMIDTVNALAGDIGPREATSESYRQAAALVEERFRALGYQTRRDELGVPAGRSWGVPVPSGTTYSVVAEPMGFRQSEPHAVVGAHLDTVPQAPGAVDNAAGVAAVLELARLAVAYPPTLPVVFVAFAAEEPRGPGDDGHHFGSRAYVDAMTREARRALVGMISLDRLGVGARVPVCTGGRTPETLADALVHEAGAAGIPVDRCENRTSDHWPFERAGLTAARVGGVEYAEYHSNRDRPSVVEPEALTRATALVWRTLHTLR